MFLHDYFLCNGYPAKLVDKTINTFLNLRLAPPPPITTVNKDVRYFKLPYMGKLSFEVRKSFKEILKNAYPQIKFNLVFTNTNTIRNFLVKRPKPNPDMCSNVVYLYKCSSCYARYVGSTSRWLKHRILEHKGRSVRTGSILGKPSFSAIRDHSHDHSHPFTATDLSILSQHTTRQDLQISESLYSQPHFQVHHPPLPMFGGAPTSVTNARVALPTTGFNTASILVFKTLASTNKGGGG